MSEIHVKPTHDKVPTLYYTGRRKREGPPEILAHTSEGPQPLDPCEWAHLETAPSNPSQLGWGPDHEATHFRLAFALLYDWAQDAHFALKHHEAFARSVITPIPYEAWSLKSSTILSYFCVGKQISVQDRASKIEGHPK